MRALHNNSLLRLLSGVALGLFLALSGAAGADNRNMTYQLDIPAQSLNDALQALALVSQHKLFYDAGLVKGKSSAALKGSFTTTEAVKRLLSGTNLTFEVTPDAAVLIREKGWKTSGLGAADQMRLAATDAAKEGASSKEEEKDSEDARQVTVRDRKIKPDFSVNADIPRTIDDAQPYYIFDAKTIEQSGATNIEGFLKQRVTMNTVAETASQSTNNLSGNLSRINLRGLGQDKTLILVNGRRRAGIFAFGEEYQPDINGIPLGAIDRIEVLPSSASGIYGGSAIGGVVNVVMKKDYSGSELRARYENTWESDSPARMVQVALGRSFEGGRTHLSLNAEWSDSKPLLFQDRREFFERGFEIVRRNNPSSITNTYQPFPGATPNIRGLSAGFAEENLVLKDGTALNSGITYIPAGTSPSTTLNELYAGLLANAGQWNFELPASNQSSYTGAGLMRPFGYTPTTKSFTGTLRRQMFPSLEAFMDWTYTSNSAAAMVNPSSAVLYVRGSAPRNPFSNAYIAIDIPSVLNVASAATWTTRSVTAGLLARLPFDWTAEFDYTWSESRHNTARPESNDYLAESADLNSGLLNPFVDVLLYPMNRSKYVNFSYEKGSTELHDFALRGAGALPALPWGAPMLAVGLEHRIAQKPDTFSEMVVPITTANSALTTYFSRKQTTNSAYVETQIPLVPESRLPLLDSLALQAAGRIERYTVSTGTPAMKVYPNRTPPEIYYGSPTLPGDIPFTAQDSYDSANGTLGIKYRPIAELTLRASLATAFLPPTPAQLLRNPVPSESPTSVLDPHHPELADGYQVQTISGGNPDLQPQNSRSWNLGLIWEPSGSILQGLRFNAEHYRIEQENAIGSLNAQMIVNYEATYPDRVTRDASGMITLVDTSSLNLYKRNTAGWDLSLDYRRTTSAGAFTLRAAGSIIDRLRNQYSLLLPEYEAAGYHPSEAGAARHKSNVTLTWESNAWTAGWATRYIGSYKQEGAVGGPFSTQYANGGVYEGRAILSQGSDTIASQIYHDVFFGYNFGRTANKMRLLDGIRMQVLIKNLFDTAPPFDAYYSWSSYVSPYGDIRLRQYAISLRREF